MPGVADHPSYPDALVGASDGAWQLGDHMRCLELADMAIALAEPGSPAWRDAHVNKSEALIWLGRIEDAITAATAAGEPSDLSAATVGRLGVLGLILNLAGRPDPALAERLLDMAHTLDNPSALALALHVAGVTVKRSSQLSAASTNADPPNCRRPLARSSSTASPWQFWLVNRQTTRCTPREPNSMS